MNANEEQRKPDRETARAEAAKLIKKYRITNPPVDVQEISEDEGYEVFYATFDRHSDEISGIFDFKESEIIVNRHIPDIRKAFTIAHELGHALLHGNHAVTEQYEALPYRHKLDDEDSFEVEANEFAMNLLVPLDFLKRFESKFTPNTLSKLFVVPRPVIYRQLAKVD